jgi:hypothetical protein
MILALDAKKQHSMHLVKLSIPEEILYKNNPAALGIVLDHV